MNRDGRSAEKRSLAATTTAEVGLEGCNHLDCDSRNTTKFEERKGAPQKLVEINCKIIEM
jgi:hypothetical protein